MNNQKECIKCKKIKLLIEFKKNKKSVDKFSDKCIECHRKSRKDYYEKNKEDILKKNLNYSEINHEKRLEYYRLYRQINKDKISKNEKQKRKKQLLEEREKDKSRYHKNREKILEERKIYYANNKTKINKKKSKYQKQKRLIDPRFRVDCNISRAINNHLKFNGISKNRRTWESLVGYTIQDLCIHLEKQFYKDPEITWKNYGKYWHIDHIIPKSFFDYKTTEEEKFKECWSLTNLQPLSAIENLKKGNRI